MIHKSISLKNKSIVLIIIILLLSKYNVFGQNLAVKFEADSVLQKGDTALIKIKDEVRGTIQWQQSYEKDNWKDITGETSSELLRVINDTTFFRVKITEESCEMPFYSDVVKINTMKVSPKTVIIDTTKTFLVSDTQDVENEIYKYLGDTDIEVTENSVLVGYKYDGYVKIVDDISYHGDTLVLNTHSGRISDIFEYYNVEDSVHLLLNDEDVKKSGTKGRVIKGKTIYQKEGVSLKKEGSGLSLSDVVLFDGTVDGIDLIIKITDGEVNFKPAFSSYFDIKLLSVDYIRLVAEGALDMNMDVSVNASSSIEFGDKINLMSISYPFAIGPVPVNIKVSFIAGFTTDLTVSGTFSTGFETTQNLAFGGSYDKNASPQWEAIWNRNGNFKEHQLEMNSESGELNAKVYIKPAISFNVGWDPFSKKSEAKEDSEKIDSTNKYTTQDTITVKTEESEKLFEFGPYLAVSPYLRYNSIIDLNGWEYGLYGGVEGELGFSVSFIGYNIADFNTTLAKWEKDIITGTSPVADFSSDSTNISPGSTVQFADESTGEPESWYWDFGDGETSTEQNPSHVYESVGNYDVSLTVNGTFGSNTETKINYITVENGGSGGNVTDTDGNVYSTVQIGNQEWMAENLKTTTYNDGTPIDLVTDNTVWENNTTGAYCWYDNDEAAYADTYGALYNWHAVNTGNLCPDGWHVPSDNEWKTLEMELGMSQADADDQGWRGTNEGSKLAGNATLWNDGDLKNNSEFGSSGFSAFPGGLRRSDGLFIRVGSESVWWSSSESYSWAARTRRVSSSIASVARYVDYAERGFSVRCLRD